MDEKVRAALQAMTRRKGRGEDVSSEEIHAVVHEGMLMEMDKADAQELGRCFVELWFAGEDLSDIPWCGVEWANDWFATDEVWGSDGRAEMLLDLIDASDDDPDARDALNHIAIRLHAERRRWPGALADWDIEVRRGLRPKPAQRRGNRGQPPYAKDRRNRYIASAEFLLGWLGMGKMDSYHVIGDVLGMSPRAVANAVRSARSLLRQFWNHGNADRYGGGRVAHLQPIQIDR